MQGKTILFTIIAKNYLPCARVLMRSAAEIHPEWRRVVLLADQVDGHFDPDAEDFEVILSTALPIPHSRWFHFKYSIMELSTAVKPYAFEYLFDCYGPEHIVYLDPDIRIYSRMDQITATLEGNASMVLTPHLTSPLDDDKRPGEIDILRSGAYNLGFIAMAGNRDSKAFLAWWQQRLYDHCVVDLPRGLFVDQRWVDLVPGMFPGVAIVRDEGCNVAYWNLAQRRVTRYGNGYEVAGGPLVFFHFSGYDPQQPQQLSRHQNRFRVEELPAAMQHLLRSYHADLLEAGYRTCKSWPFAFGFFRNGTRIPDVGRPIHHEAPDLLARIEDPFSDEGFQAFVEQWNRPVENDGFHSGISRLAYRIYRTRTDVQSAMPDIFGGHYRSFLEWVLVSGKVEHGLGDVFLQTVTNAIATCKDHQHARAWPEVGSPSELVAGSGDEPMPSNGEASGLRLTRLAAAIYGARPELQRYFPDPCGRDSLRFLVWLLTYGRKEHNLSPAHLAPLKAQWRSIVARLPGWPARLRYHLVMTGMAVSVHVRSLLARRSVWQWSLRVRELWPAGCHRIPAEVKPPSERGINLIGYFQSETGVGQSVRAARAAIQTTGIPLSLKSVDEKGWSRQDDSAGRMSVSFPYDTNLFYVNADQTHVVRRNLGDSFYRDHHNIGFWVWELDEFPEQWLSAFTPYQEIWTPSTFCRNAVARKARIPTFCVPYSVSPSAPAGMDRQYFGLPADRFIFLTAFDVLSVVERKNPMAVIRAFEKAFGPDSGCELVVKVSHASAGPDAIQRLRKACSSSSVRILDSVLRREEMDALTNCADCIVSLHRAEGFGLLIAEAMYFGKPVVVTNYSGNTDFTRAGNSLLVDYKMTPVGQNCAPYNPSSYWADPDVGHAASQLRFVASNPDHRRCFAAAGQAFVRQALSPETVGAAMLTRIQDLQARCPPQLMSRAAHAAGFRIV